MKFTTKAALLAGASIATAMLSSGGAYAQSTASQQAEGEGTAVTEVVVTGRRGPRSIEGLAVAEQAARSRASITSEYIDTQPAGQTILNSVNLLPAVNFTNNDAYGSAGGDITLRGFDSARISLTQDGIPLNDTGNYAIYSNQQNDPEIIERANVNLGTTDFDSPTASATGGTINYTTRRPYNDFTVTIQPSAGSFAYRRLFAAVDSGEFGPWGTRAFITYSNTAYDWFRDPGGVHKEQVNAQLFQDLGGGDFFRILFNYNENRNNFSNRVRLSDFQNSDVYESRFGNSLFCNLPSFLNAGPGRQDDGAAGICSGNVSPTTSNFFRTSINPSNTGNLRASLSYHLRDDLRLTVDPSFQYTLANGGGRTAFNENDLQLRGNSTAAGVDLNGDGDILDRVLLYTPNTTNTRRYGLSTSLIWDINPTNRVIASYTFDYGMHRQTGDVGYFERSGDPEDVFGGKDGYGRQVVLPDGTNLRRRDRASVAGLNQISFRYDGDFFEDRLHVTLGVRAPFFHRELNQFCFQRDTFNAYCTTQTGFVVPGTTDGNGQPYVVFPGGGALVGTASGAEVLTGANLTAYRAFFGTTATNSPFYGQPRRFEKDYEAILPNVGATWRFDDANQIYISYAEGLSAPRTDDLYDRPIPDPDPERTQSFDIGYRFQTPTVNFSVAAFYNHFDNRIVRTFDEAAGIFLSRNVGEVILTGVDGQVGWQVNEDLTLFGSASYVDAEVQNDLPNGLNAPPLPTAGRQLVEIPRFQAGFRAEYTMGPVQFGWQTKYVGDRYATDVNDERAPSYTTTDVDVRWDLAEMGWRGSFLQLNIVNLFDEAYLADISSGTNRLAIPGVTSSTSAALYQVGAPLTAMVTLRAQF